MRVTSKQETERRRQSLLTIRESVPFIIELDRSLCTLHQVLNVG